MEESIRRKLVVDGEGMGDDRRIILLTKLLMKWASGQDAESGERESTLKKIEVALSQTEFGMEKASRVHHMNEQQCVLYDQLAKKIEQQMEEAHHQIVECKLELQEAKQIRKHRQEYDALAIIIQQNPERKETLKQLEEVRKEIEAAEHEKRALEERLEQRRNEFQVLMTTLLQLKQLLVEDERRRGGGGAGGEKIDTTATKVENSSESLLSMDIS